MPDAPPHVYVADLKRHAGEVVRVRGWLKWRNGPAISVTHPEQIEVLTQ